MRLTVYLIGLLLGLALHADETPKQIELPEFHHVVNVKPSRHRRIDESLKLGEQGELVCSTCHGLKEIEKVPKEKWAQIDTEDADFLHGGAYKPLTDFCYRCHDEAENQRENIHLMFDEKGEIKKQACEYCHEAVPDRKKELTVAQRKLRLPMELMCYGCHLKDPHFNAVEHQDKPEKKEMVEHLEQMQKKNAVYMPLSAEGKVMCVTCHTPHQRGVIDIAEPAGKQVENNDPKQRVAYQAHPWNSVFTADKQVRLDELNSTLKSDYQLHYQRIEKEVLLRLPAINGQLCLSCHDFER